MRVSYYQSVAHLLSKRSIWQMNSESPTLTNEDVDDLLGKVEDISGNSAASRQGTNAQSNVL